MKNFLEKLVNSVPGYVAVVNIDMKIICANEDMAKVQGYASIDNIIGLSYHDQRCEAAKYADAFEEQNKLALTSKNTVKILSYNCYSNDQWKLLFGTKSPLYDNQGKIIGTLDVFHNITNYNLLDMGRLLINKTSDYKFGDQIFHYILEETDPVFRLSRRQLECLFFLLRGKTSKMIAKILDLSFRTVEFHIESIKKKMNCNSKSELIEKAITVGYMNILPQSLFDNNTKTNILAKSYEQKKHKKYW